MCRTVAITIRTGLCLYFVWIPISLILLSCSAAGWMAYGIDPSFTAGLGGLATVMMTRKLQWILLILSIIPCLILIVRVGMARCRAWWLLGLAIVLAMMFVRFSPSNTRPVRVLERDNLPLASDIRFNIGDEYVVGFSFAGTNYAIPCRSLYRTPIMVLTDFDKRCVIIWSPFANMASIQQVTRDIRGSDLEFVSMPANSTLIYNRKYGEFITGVTGTTDRRTMPTGFKNFISSSVTPWHTWRQMHPDTRVLVPSTEDEGYPGMPLMPRYPTTHPSTPTDPPDNAVLLVRTNPPIVFDQNADFTQPRNERADKQLVLIFRRTDGAICAFDRTVQTDLYLKFEFQKDKRNRMQLIDRETRSVWNVNGQCIEGDLKGEHLRPIDVIEPVYQSIVDHWFPDAIKIK